MTGALAELLKSTSEPVALVSRAEELERCDPDTLRQFDAVYVMAANTDLDDAEDPEEVARGSNSRSGLHAKVLAAKRGWNTHLYLGSANATSSALLTGVNVEIMVELAGRTSAVPGKGIEGLLSTDGFGALLQAYEPPTTPQAPDPQQEHAERAIAEAACALMQAGLILRFTADAESYAPTLHSPAPLPLTGIASARTWLITTDISSARPLEPLGRGEPVRLAATPSAAATSLVAFELIAEAAPSISKQLVLKLPVLGMPADRDAQIVRTIVNNKERLIQYILSLLKVLDPFVRAGLGDDRGASGWATRGIPQGAGLLERLVRTKARHPERLTDVHAVLRDLTATAEGRDIVPPELLRVWQIITGETLE
jgi:hypothetical protein